MLRREMPQISFRLPDDVREEFERGMEDQNMTAVDYFTSLILEARGRVSGLSERVWESGATDARLSGVQAQAIAAILRNDSDEALRLMRVAQDIMIDAIGAKKAIVSKAVDERIRVKGGSDDWAHVTEKKRT